MPKKKSDQQIKALLKNGGRSGAKDDFNRILTKAVSTKDIDKK